MTIPFEKLRAQPEMRFLAKAAANVQIRAVTALWLPCAPLEC
jgi:hypothetical protein